MVPANVNNRWGTGQEDFLYHLLVHHCLDVAAVGRVILEQDRIMQRRYSFAMEIDKEVLEPFLIFFLFPSPSQSSQQLTA